MKNCRTCKHAKWYIKPSGRRSFSHYAECAYPVVVVLPASRFYAARQLETPVAVRHYGNVPMDCAAYEPIPKG